MSGSSRKTGRRLNSHKNCDTSMRDVTLNDFANSSVTKGQGRLKKSTRSTYKEVKRVDPVDDDRTWEEKADDYDEFEVFEDCIVEEREVSYERQSAKCKKKYKENGGVEYPVDIWFLISEQIFPEDIGVFAAICKNSLHVIRSARFWFHLYRRFYRPTPELPEILEPESMIHRYGLRSRVIRALYITYVPFVNRIKSTVAFHSNPHQLIKRHCILLWHQKQKGLWIFNFKLKQASFTNSRRNNISKGRMPDLIEMLEDISVNQEEGCKVLQITCLHYVQLPMVLGLVLCGLKVGLSADLRYHRIRLEFGSGPICTQGVNIVTFEPVIAVRVLDWWHPHYPHCSSVIPCGQSEDIHSDLFFSKNWSDL